VQLRPESEHDRPPGRTHHVARQRTGNFRLGKDQLLVDAKGQSRISVEDYAMAMINEVKKPAHIRQRFTVGY
ncbi:MAG TPA: hypothetical protein PKJ04_13990, partial [Nitrospira sp.]|nr:hypothetical protein [Nitrospira sp.]HNN43848.1 hypothetical protein [Nitrospira sp.]HUM40849.1 hypothetical protein [Nitrospira sp.]